MEENNVLIILLGYLVKLLEETEAIVTYFTFSFITHRRLEILSSSFGTRNMYMCSN